MVKFFFGNRKTGLFWGVIYIFFPKVKVQNWNIFWGIGIFQILLALWLIFLFFGGGGRGLGVNSRWRVQAYV